MQLQLLSLIKFDLDFWIVYLLYIQVLTKLTNSFRIIFSFFPHLQQFGSLNDRLQHLQHLNEFVAPQPFLKNIKIIPAVTISCEYHVTFNNTLSAFLTSSGTNLSEKEDNST